MHGNTKFKKNYCPTGRRNHGRLLKRLLDTWDRNGSTGGPTAWQIYDDDDDYEIFNLPHVLANYNKGITQCVQHVWNVMAHARKPDLVLQRHGRVHLNRPGDVSSVDYCAAEVCASAVVMLDKPCSDVACKATGFPIHSHVSPSLPLPCVTVCHQVSTELYYCTKYDRGAFSSPEIWPSFPA